MKYTILILALALSSCDSGHGLTEKDGFAVSKWLVGDYDCDYTGPAASGEQYIECRIDDLRPMIDPLSCHKTSDRRYTCPMYFEDPDAVGTFDVIVTEND